MPRDWRERFAALLGRDDGLETFIAELFAAEKPCLTGHANFEYGVATVLGRWDCAGTLADALSIWTHIEVDADVVAAIASLRRSGVGCFLASNQQAFRAAYMRTLGYEALFDRTFYSYQLGCAKPDRAYFGRVPAELAVPAHDVLFIDDVAANVASAQQTGIRAVHFAANAGVSALWEHLAAPGISPA
jgi:putative hydrolase of the HAD superfamily